MNIKITARHFKPHASLTAYAESAIEDLTKFYDGIIKAEVIFSYEMESLRRDLCRQLSDLTAEP